MIHSAKAASPHDVLHWTVGNSWAVRQGDWKLIGNPRDTSSQTPLAENDRLFLSNLAEDVTEGKNVAREHPEIVSRLKALHEQWENAHAPF